MLPLYLSIEGLYSYQQKQEIDFTTLTQTGLFGIFGKVGSGKSSILEAIGFVLYGETERLNKQEKRTYNMLNLKSNAACIAFDFLNFQGNKYRFVAQWRRRKKFEDTTTLERTAYQWIDEQWVPLTSADGSQITNLTYSNFRRTIIIPQGQFKEFLELRGKDRSEMMKEIFNLNRFDLGQKVIALQRKNTMHLDVLKGTLSGFEEVSVETLQSKQTELVDAQNALQTIKSEHTFLEAEIARLSQAKKYRADLEQKTKSLEQFVSEESKVQQLENELEIYVTTSQAFRELLNHTHTLNKDKEHLTHKIEGLDNKKHMVLERLEQTEEQWKNTAAQYAQIEQFRTQAEDLKHLSLIAENKIVYSTNVKRLNEGKPHLEDAHKEELEILNDVGKKEKELEDLKANKLDTTILLNLESWYQQNDNYQKKQQELSEQLHKLTKEKSEINEEFRRQGFTLDTWEAKIDEHEKALEEKRNHLRHDETHLRVQAKLVEFADNLSSGTPCPLCGALEHPHPMVKSDLLARESRLNSAKQEIEGQIYNLKMRSQKFASLNARYHEKVAQQNQIETVIADIRRQQDAHKSLFVWTNFSKDDQKEFLNYKKENQQSESKIKIADNALKQARTNLQTVKIRVDKYQTTLQEIQQSIAISESIIVQHQNQLRLLDKDDYKTETATAITAARNQLYEKIQTIDSSYKDLSESLQQLRTEFATINAERNASKEQFQSLSQTLNGKQAEISSLLKEHKYNDIIEVQQTLQKNLEVPSLRKKIQEFNLNIGVLRSQISDLAMRIQADDFDEINFHEQSELLILKRQELELQIGLTTALDRENLRLQTEFSKKEKLLENYEKLNTRKSNLTTLENLFRGSGFVNFVSSIHLQRLCEIANQRFHRLTRNGLSLTINDQNEFEVVDFLNDGHRRSVKTLSGGQSFQASLCLALALAENIQSLNKADKNFFFIDEGFGTQDAESINIVFETLQYLQRENRIVGIISHVDALKEKISSSITVINDADKGSQVNYG
ncbi:AAA family ATPase [Sphingobacterium sp. JB170]|uniref:AAA family ATPase n=1 Tax=Sphingobacterium sp. JB170 TaxID=1434842 RepID=UPI00097EF05A|nr:SMC family ATPase [Sphingobacterium sp. JB170]SJN45319.1 Exonuclease SbcC [Sphingobacterium sp. JB170]